MPTVQKPRMVVTRYPYSNAANEQSTVADDSQSTEITQSDQKELISTEHGTFMKDAGDSSASRPSQQVIEATADDDENKDAPVPAPFQYIESLEEPKSRRKHHVSGPLPEFYTIGDAPEDLTELPPLEYYELDPNVDPVRILVVLPHFGNPYSTVQCNLFPVSLAQEHYCFAAIKNTRGNKNLRSNIIVNGQVKSITRNLEVFLRHFRKENYAVMVWIREICIDAVDGDYHRTPEWRDEIFRRACALLNMADFMYGLEQRGVLEKEKQYTVRPKEWNKTIRDMALPTHFPIALRTFTNEQIRGNELDIPIVDHEYLPLDLVAEEIRLLVLMPSEDRSAPLITHLAHESIYGPTVYQCLSYTWGAGIPSKDIVLNGQRLKITENLDSALRALRHPTNQQTIWVDAVCINQEDVGERSRQVSRMHQIFEMADCVLIWLGGSDEDSDLAMDFIRGLGRPDWSAFDDGYDAPSIEHCRAWAAIYRLLQRPYFRRLWIVQELALASLPTAFCGKKFVAWSDIHDASLRLRIHEQNIRDRCSQFGIDIGAAIPPRVRGDGCPACTGPRTPQRALRLSHKLSWHRQMRKSAQAQTFLYLCILNRDTECSDPRDKIFALWNLALEATDLGFQPDYTQSINNIYGTFAKSYITTTRSLDIICVPHTPCLRNSKSHLHLHLPSWVPDWRAGPPMNSYLRPVELPLSHVEELGTMDSPIYSASRNTKAITSFHSEERDGSLDVTTLICAGILVDKVLHISDSAHFEPSQWYTLAKQWCHRGGRPLPEDELNRQFWSMLLGDATCSFEADLHVDNTGDYNQVRVRNTSKPSPESTTLLRTVQLYPGNVMQPSISGRRFIVTEKGYMGLAPMYVEAGHELAILLGCSVPVLLERHDGHCHVKGDCFVQGWMKGEILDELGMSDEDVEKHVCKTMEPIVLL